MSLERCFLGHCLTPAAESALAVNWNNFAKPVPWVSSQSRWLEMTAVGDQWLVHPFLWMAADSVPGDFAKEGLTRLSEAIEKASENIKDGAIEASENIKDGASEIKTGLIGMGIALAGAQALKAFLEFKVIMYLSTYYRCL
jgi:hypothetical protein